MNKISVMMIVCKKRYARVAAISVPSFIKYHPKHCLNVIVDNYGRKALGNINAKNLKLINLKELRKEAEDKLNVHSFCIFNYHGLAHDRAYSSMKPVLMEIAAIQNNFKSDYILGIDADSIFTGNITDELENNILIDNGKYEMYMVERKDRRMLIAKNKEPASGFVLWKRKGRYLSIFKKKFNNSHGSMKGGSQDLTNNIRKAILHKILKNPFLHFVGPDLKNPEIKDEEIFKFKPAYIHLHGPEPRKRLLRFKRVFENANKKY